MRSQLDKFGFEVEGEFRKRMTTDGAMTLWDTGLAFGSWKGDPSVRHCKEDNKFHKLDGNARREYEIREFASKPFDVKELDNVKEFFSLLENNYHWNSSAGLHVHVSFKPMLAPEIFCRVFAEYFHNKLREKYPEIYDTRGVGDTADLVEDTRNNPNSFSKILPYSDTSLAKIGKEPISEDRYRSINFVNAYEDHGTIEFRIYPSDTPSKMYEYLKFTIDTVDEYLKNNSKLSIFNRSLDQDDVFTTEQTTISESVEMTLLSVEDNHLVRLGVKSEVAIGKIRKTKELNSLTIGDRYSVEVPKLSEYNNVETFKADYHSIVGVAVPCRSYDSCEGCKIHIRDFYKCGCAVCIDYHDKGNDEDCDCGYCRQAHLDSSYNCGCAWCDDEYDSEHAND